MRSWLSRSLPILSWLPRYRAHMLRGDVSAGLVTAVMLIPQGMAYAMLAGLPPIIGLYASTVPLVVYALLGSSRQLAVGPMAIASLLLATALHELIPPEQATEASLVTMAAVLTLLAGAFQILMGVFRLGGLVNLLSHPVVSGFTGAAAIVIGVSQLQHLLGIRVPRGLSSPQTLLFVWNNLAAAHLPTLGVGISAMALIVVTRRVAPGAPGALIAVVLGILASFLLGFEQLGIRVLGEIPRGMPSPQLPPMSLELVERAAPLGLAIALIGFMESISAAKIYARKHRYTVSPTVELASLGLANLSAGLFGGYTVGGALSRTAVNDQAGAVTPLAGVVTALAIGFALAFLTPLFYYLPTPILAAIILVAVTGLIDVQEVIHLWRIKRDDLLILGITFSATLFGPIEAGILIGVLASLLWLVFTTTRPEIASLGRIPGTRSYRSIQHFPEAEAFDHILILRMDAQFFFGNVVYLKDSLFERLDGVHEPLALVLDASSMNSLDSTAADTYSELIAELRRQHVEVFISHVKGSVLRVMEQTGLIELLGEGHLFYEVDDAVQAALRHRDAAMDGISPEEEDFGPSDMID